MESQKPTTYHASFLAEPKRSRRSIPKYSNNINQENDTCIEGKSITATQEGSTVHITCGCGCVSFFATIEYPFCALDALDEFHKVHNSHTFDTPHPKHTIKIATNIQN